MTHMKTKQTGFIYFNSWLTATQGWLTVYIACPWEDDSLVGKSINQIFVYSDHL